jgi:acyl-CoA synthetase (AMP-forming)/AMP-acid ligase II
MELIGRPLDARVDVTSLLGRGLAHRPDEVAVVAAESRMTWRELDHVSAQLASGYLRAGLEPGDRLASLMPNRVELVVHYLACFKAGIVATPLNYRYTTPEIDHALDVSGAAALVHHVERTDDVAATRLAATLPVGLIAAGGAYDGPTLEALMASPPTDLPPHPGVDAPAAIFFTSGSTGPAKGVTHSYETLGWMAASAGAAFEITEADSFLPASSMSHIGSFLWALMSLAAGAPVVVARTFDAGEVLVLLREHRPTILAMIPAALTALVRDHGAGHDDFASLRICRSGADAVSAELESEFSHLVGFLIDEGYGMTETGLATLNPPSGEIRRGSIGPPIPGVDIQLLDDDGAEVAVGDVGRVWIRTRSRTVGYWRNPEATAEIVRGDWLDSGDLARADEDGYLWFFGRKKQIIVHDGSNISPFEVESALAEHPAVALVGVVGIRDEVHGENVRAYVTVAEDTAQPTSQELIEFARARVGYKAPEEVVFLPEMPLNPTGKLDRVGLKRLAEEHLHPHLAARGPA